MLSNQDFKIISSLKNKKFREQYHSFVIEGIHGVEEAVKSGLQNIIKIIMSESFSRNNPHTQFPQSLTVDTVSDKSYQMMSTMKTPPGIMVWMEKYTSDWENFQDRAPDVVYLLDNIQDPGNLGTIIRTCDWFGLAFLLVNSDTVDEYNPKTLQSSMGSIHRVKVLRDTNIGIGQHTKHYCKYTTDMHGKNYNEVLLEEPAMIVIGNESHGISDFWRQPTSHTLSIPSHHNVESLNAAIAHAIFCARFH